MTSLDYVLDVRCALPRMDEDTGSRQMPATVTATHSGPRHVLVVDDEPAIRDIFREVLADEGCRVTGLAAPPTLQDIARLAPDVIVLDLDFSGQKTGLSLLDALHLSPATARIPIVVCTALTDPGVVASLGEITRPISVLRKPFDLDDAVAVVRSVVGGCNADRTA